jgi:hypothetical protein
MAFPIFYAIALLAITIQYIIERYTLAMFYRLPPKFCLAITELNVKILSFGPVIGTAISFWMFGNKQMFSNKDIPPMNSANEITPSHHTLGETFKNIITFKLSWSENL